MGTIIGAGFATGQEIYIFFAKYKMYGIIGIIISSFIISYVLYIVLKNINTNNFKNYSEYISHIFKNNKFFCYLNQNIITIFLLLTFYIMELGFASLLYQQYGISKYIGMLIITVLSYVVLKGNVQSVIKINVILIPILIVALLYISIKGIHILGLEQINLETNTVNTKMMFLVNAIIYSSYNFIMLLPLITGINEKNLTIKQIKIICLAIFLIIVISNILLLMLLNIIDVNGIEIPLIYIANYISNNDIILCLILILLAIFTSVVCVGYSFLNNISKTPKKYNRNLLMMCSASFLLIEFSFANTMQITYTFLGILGIIQILAIIYMNFRRYI